MEKKKITAGGGCSAKVGPGVLSNILKTLPEFHDDNLLVGFDSSDDAAVYKISDEIAIVQTLDFFTPIVDDPYTFGLIAATNALSDIYAMGAEVKVALNIACFDENEDAEIFAEIMRGGAEKVLESGGVLCGGHSVNSKEIKYGLSVTGTVHPDKILKNNASQIGDCLILTKPIGVGLVMAARKMGEASEEAYQEAIKSMTTLNKYAAQIMKKYEVNACTDVTGFGFLGHLVEMVPKGKCARIFTENIPHIDQALDYAKEFFITAAGQKNRNHVTCAIDFGNTDFAMQELLFDPQTSGGLLISVKESDAQALLNELNLLELKSNIVGKIEERTDKKIILI